MKFIILLLIATNCFSITITAVGDIAAGDEFTLDSNILNIMQSDIVFGNIEGTICDKKGIPKYCQSNCFRIKSPSIVAYQLQIFTVVNLGNNHINDFGSICKQETINSLNYYGIFTIGLIECPEKIIEKNNQKIGFIGFSPCIGSLNINDIDSAIIKINCLKEKCNIVVVSFHAGCEGDNFQHITKSNEKCYGENRGNVYMFSHLAINAGADLIIGHGPHVVRGIEVYKNRLILYSLGNFYVNTSIVSIKNKKGIAPIVKVTLTDNGELDSAQIFSIKQSCTMIDSTNEAFNDMIKLSEQDSLKRFVFNNNVIRKE